MLEKYKRIVFCDFDGTITTEDGFVHVCNHFAPKESKKFLSEVLEGRMSLKDGIRMILEAIPSSEYPAMLEYVKTSVMRSGLNELLDFLEQRGVPFIVVSGGLKGLVESQLGEIVERTEAVYAANVETTEEYLKVVSEFDNGPELVNKTQVMQKYSYDEAISIGDGITDHNMALASSVVFARKHLAEYLKKNNHPYYLWDDFHEVKRILTRLWGH